MDTNPIYSFEDFRGSLLCPHPEESNKLGPHKIIRTQTAIGGFVASNCFLRGLRLALTALNHKNPTPAKGSKYNSKSQRPNPAGVASTLAVDSPSPCELCKISRARQNSCRSRFTSVLYSTCPRKFSRRVG